MLGSHSGPSRTAANVLSWQVVKREVLLCLMPHKLIFLGITIKIFNLVRNDFPLALQLLHVLSKRYTDSSDCDFIEIDDQLHR